MSLTHEEWSALVQAYERLCPSAMWMWDPGAWDDGGEVVRVDCPEDEDEDTDPTEPWEGDDYAALWVADAMRDAGFAFDATDAEVVHVNRTIYRERNGIEDDDPREAALEAQCVADYRAEHPRKGA